MHFRSCRPIKRARAVWAEPRKNRADMFGYLVECGTGEREKRYHLVLLIVYGSSELEIERSSVENEGAGMEI